MFVSGLISTTVDVGDATTRSGEIVGDTPSASWGKAEGAPETVQYAPPEPMLAGTCWEGAVRCKRQTVEENTMQYELMCGYSPVHSPVLNQIPTLQ